VPPAYYVHLAAFRARFYMEPDPSDTGSMTSGAPPGRGGMGGAGRGTRAPGPSIGELVKVTQHFSWSKCPAYL
jgi:hypothetical protein